MAAFIGALKSVEVMVMSPSDSVLTTLVLTWFLTAKYWLAGAAVGVLGILGWIARRFGPPRPVEPPARRPPGEARTRNLGFNLVACWIGFGILAMIVMFDTRTGPFAWFAHTVLDWDAAVPFATLLLGPITLAIALVIIALIPRQDRWPLFAAVQERVQPIRKRRSHVR